MSISELEFNASVQDPFQIPRQESDVQFRAYHVAFLRSLISCAVEDMAFSWRDTNVAIVEKTRDTFDFLFRSYHETLKRFLIPLNIAYMVSCSGVV